MKNFLKLIFNNQNEVNLEFTCSESLQQNDNASLIPADKQIAAVVLYTVHIQNSNGNTCNKSKFYVDRDLVLTDTLFHSYSTKTISSLSKLNISKMKFMEKYYAESRIDLEEWQQLLQIETIEFLLEKLTQTKHHNINFGKLESQLNSIKGKFNELKSSKHI